MKQEEKNGTQQQTYAEQQVALMVRLITSITIIIVSLLLIFSSFYIIDETEAVVITTFGRADVVTERGLHFKIPFIQEKRRIKTVVQGMSIGYMAGADGVTESVPSESVMITSDFNFIDCDFYIQYRVADPIKYLYASQEPVVILKNIAMSSIRSVISAYSVDSAITTGKPEIQSNIRAMIQSELEDEDIGLVLTDVSIQDSEPPTQEVINAFKAVETARQDKEATINVANAYRNAELPKAEAKADQIIQNAEATKNARINEAKGQVARFESEYAEYKNYPLITKRRMFLETMNEVLPKLNVMIDNESTGEVKKFTNINDMFSDVKTNKTEATISEQLVEEEN